MDSHPVKPPRLSTTLLSQPYQFPMSTSTFQSHHSILESSARSYPTRPAFRTPVVNEGTSQISEWATITYTQFYQDVQLYARYWSSILSADSSVASGSIIGLWYVPPLVQSSITDFVFDSRLGGIAYTDVLHVYGMTRAGYIPQMFSLRLPNPIVIFELLQKTGARALVCEPSFCVDLSGCPVLTYSAIKIREQDVADVALPPLRIDYSASDLVFIFHTSGSTSGRPKLVPCNRRWLDNVVTKSKQLAQVRSTQGQDVAVAMYGDIQNCLVPFFNLTIFSILPIHSGSMCHMGQTLSKRPTPAPIFAKCVNRRILV